MRLHQNKEAFVELSQATARSLGLPEIYIEKDYWIAKALKHLADSEFVNHVVFKGGTSLSKAYRIIDRFSEDIDLAVIKGDKSGNAINMLLWNAYPATLRNITRINIPPAMS